MTLYVCIQEAAVMYAGWFCSVLSFSVGTVHVYYSYVYLIKNCLGKLPQVVSFSSAVNS